VEVWKQVLRNSEKAQIVIGAVSIILPFADLGFVIVDEEHEQTFNKLILHPISCP
jgi:primosomal protein N' (replication factor Y)